MAEIAGAVPAPVAQEAIKLTTTEILAAGGPEFLGTMSKAETRDAQAKGARWRSLLQDGAKPTDIFHAMVDRAKGYLPRQASQLDKSFGAWKRNETGQLEVDASDTEATMLAETTRPDIGRIRDFLAYSQMEAEAANTPGKTSADIFEAKRNQVLPGDARAYKVIRENALDAILATDPTGATFGELPDTLDGKRTYIEEKLARDSEFVKNVMARMRDIDTRSKNLTKPPKDAKLDLATRERNDAVKTRDDSITDAIATLESDLAETIPSGLPKDIKDQLTTSIKSGKSTEDVLRELRVSLMSPGSMPHLDKFKALQQNLAKAHDLEMKIKGYAGLPESVTAPSQKQLEALTADNATIELGFTTDPDIAKEYATYQAIRDATSPAKEEGSYVNLSARNLKTAVDVQREVAKAEKTIKEQEVGAAEAMSAWRDARLTEESDISADLGNVLSAAVGETLENRYQKLQDAIRADMAKTAEKARPGIIKGLTGTMDKNWGHYDERNRRQVFNTRRIGMDIRYVTYHGEDGARRLMMRDLGLQIPQRDAQGNVVRDVQGNALPQTELVFDDQGNPLKDTHGNLLKQTKPTDWRTADIDALTDEDKAMFEEVYRACGETWKTKLFTDYQMARTQGGLRGSWRGARLELKPFEDALLAEKFSTTYDSQIEKPEALKQAIADAKEKSKKGGGLLSVIAAFAAGMASKAGR
jgi:hypothetical protein